MEIKTYYYESVLFDTGAGSNTMAEGFHFDEISLDGMHLVGNHEYPLTFNLDQSKILGSAFMRIEHGKLLANIQSIKSISGMYPNIGFEVHKQETTEGRVIITECTLRWVGVGPGENTDPNIPRIGRASKIRYEATGDEIN